MKLFFICILLLLSGCGSPDSDGSSAQDPSLPPRTTVTEFLLPSADGTDVYGNDFVSIDASNTSEGYVMVRYTGPADKSRLQMTAPDGTLYSYFLKPGDYQTFPLSGGSGSYHLEIYEHAYDNKYALAFPRDLEVSLRDEFKPFLYPNQYCWYTADSEAVKYGMELSDASASDLNYVEQVYDYVTGTISYDEELAKNIPTDYIPDIDAVMASKKGICFDYASLMGRHAPIPGNSHEAGGGLFRAGLPRLDQRLSSGDRLGGRHHFLRREGLDADGSHAGGR